MSSQAYPVTSTSGELLLISVSFSPKPIISHPSHYNMILSDSLSVCVVAISTFNSILRSFRENYVEPSLKHDANSATFVIQSVHSYINMVPIFPIWTAFCLNWWVQLHINCSISASIVRFFLLIINVESSKQNHPVVLHLWSPHFSSYEYKETLPCIL